MHYTASMRQILVAAFAITLSGAEFNGVEFSKPGGISLTLDANIPDGKGPFPTVIIVHGGGWINGNQRTYVTPLFEPLTKTIPASRKRQTSSLRMDGTSTASGQMLPCQTWHG